MLMGEYRHNIDEKKRLVIPSKFRSELGEQFILTRGLDKCLFIYSMPEWNKIVEKIKTLPFTQQAARNFSRLLLSGATVCEIDQTGRISITSPLVEYADIKKECVIIGVSDRLEVWAKESWDKFMDDNMDNFSEIAENLFISGDNNAL